MEESLWEQATESDWPEEERRQWYRERPADREYYRIQRELLRDGLTRKAKLTQLPPHQEGERTLWAIGFEGKSPLRLPEAEHYPLHVSLAFDDELTEQQKRDLEEEWGVERETTCTSTSSPAAPPASSPSSGTPWPTRGACSGPAPPATMASDGRCTSASSKGMEERRRGGFRVRPSFGQVLGYFCHFVHSNVERRLVAGENTRSFQSSFTGKLQEQKQPRL